MPFVLSAGDAVAAAAEQKMLRQHKVFRRFFQFVKSFISGGEKYSKTKYSMNKVQKENSLFRRKVSMIYCLERVNCSSQKRIARSVSIFLFCFVSFAPSCS